MSLPLNSKLADGEDGQEVTWCWCFVEVAEALSVE